MQVHYKCIFRLHEQCAVINKIEHGNLLTCTIEDSRAKYNILSWKQNPGT